MTGPVQVGVGGDPLSQAQFDEWLGIALQGAPDVWMTAPEQFTPDASYMQ